MIFHNLSFRYKIPLRGTALILITSLSITAALIFHAYDDLKQDLSANTEALGNVMAHTLIPAILKDDVWDAYKIIRTPFTEENTKHPSLQPTTIIVLDTNSKVYVASDPQTFQMLEPIAAAGEDYLQLQKYIGEHRSIETETLDLADTNNLYVTTPIVSDDVHLGTLVMAYNREGFTPRFVRFSSRAALVTLFVLAALLPLSWYWGARLADPLVKLAGCLAHITHVSPGKMKCELYESKDEIGQVGTRLKQMLVELQAKEDLEQQMIAAERLAAVGRLTASIAHEINNPLGGMLNAISTHRRYGQVDAMSEKTLSLLERGLVQIRDTVSALLVESKPSNRDFGPEDIEDVRTLLMPEILQQKASLEWDVDIPPVALSATLIRQILINLLLNAIKAVPAHGRIGCHIHKQTGTLVIRVHNDGISIPTDQMAHLFEPFVHYHPHGNGLGLWVCYQIINQLDGCINATSGSNSICFTATIPLPS